MVYNEQRTKCMCFKPAVLKNLYVPNVELNGKALELVTREKYLVSLSLITVMMMSI